MENNIFVLYKSRTHVTREAGDSEWDGDDTSIDTKIKGWSSSGRSFDFYSEEMPVPFKPDRQKTYYLVYATYNTGDSFHVTTGEIEFIHVYETPEVAEKVAKMLINAAPFESVKIPIDDTEKKTMDFYTGAWSGYFEHLISVDVATISYLTPP